MLNRKEFQNPNSHAIIDLETLGTTPGHVILSVGICVVRLKDQDYPEWEKIWTSQFHFNLQESIDAGFKVNADTLLWWLEQSEEARTLMSKGIDNYNSNKLELISFNKAFDALGESVFVWGNSNTFDLEIFKEYFKYYKVPISWNTKNERDLRTLRYLFPHIKEVAHTGVEHRALDDAIHEAEQLLEFIKIFPYTNEPPKPPQE